ncbi:uncharacterized protein TRIADDRAFT_54371 [Trichoplax adhaerens]|uniref:Uncharacterized protein n=1 Tax=Trichoplax adhaerens TaxID=10228 RepID=B3RRU6_TRIAD|nr:predicted protein [Trichoplax adhaerens]EDV26933.1 predicted protein [Trichoplax adhaerens]|eukprot:XP_002110929.1 predicted protein [Trichoplax adhaerens]
MFVVKFRSLANYQSIEEVVDACVCPTFTYIALLTGHGHLKVCNIRSGQWSCLLQGVQCFSWILKRNYNQIDGDYSVIDESFGENSTEGALVVFNNQYVLQVYCLQYDQQHNLHPNMVAAIRPEELLENKLLSTIYEADISNIAKWNILSSTLDRIVMMIDNTFIVGFKFDSDKLKICYVVDLTTFMNLGKKLTDDDGYGYVSGKVQLGLIFLLFQYGCICILLK